MFQPSVCPIVNQQTERCLIITDVQNKKFSLEKNVNKEGKTFPVSTQLTFTCSKLTIEILEKGVEYVQS